MMRPDRALGPGHDVFWAWCAKGELRLPQCADCGHLHWPVVDRCEECGHTTFAWVPMSGRAKLISWCRFERDYYRGLLPMPYDTILVELEEGPLFISNPMGITPGEFAFNTPLILRFQASEDKAGLFQLPMFAPL